MRETKTILVTREVGSMDRFDRYERAEAFEFSVWSSHEFRKPLQQKLQSLGVILPQLKVFLIVRGWMVASHFYFSHCLA